MLVGCGGSDGGDDAGGSFRSTYIAHGDAICRRSNDEVRPLNKEIQRTAGAAGSQQQALGLIAPLLGRASKIQQRAVADFAKLQPPPGDGEVVDEINEAAKAQAALVRQLADAARDRDASRFTTVRGELEQASTKTRELLRDYGFRECGRGGAASR